MKRNVCIFLLIFVLLSMLCLGSFAGSFDASDANSADIEHLYSIPYDIEINTNTGITITDTGGGLQLLPSYYTASSSNSVVNALYYGNSVLVRKASTIVSKNITDGKGTMRFYNEITNLNNIQSYDVTMTFHNVAVTDVTTLNIQFDGDVTAVSSFTTFPKVTYNRTNLGDTVDMMRIDVDFVEEDYGLLGIVYYYGDKWNNEVFIDDYVTTLSDAVSDENPGVTFINGIPICELNVTFRVNANGGKISYSILQDYNYEGLLHNPYEFESFAVYPIDYVMVDDNIVSWLGDCVESVFSIEVFEGITLSTIIWACIGVGLVIMFIKFFAGG